jgi:hypothetical protein
MPGVGRPQSLSKVMAMLVSNSEMSACCRRKKVTAASTPAPRSCSREHTKMKFETVVSPLRNLTAMRMSISGVLEPRAIPTRAAERRARDLSRAGIFPCRHGGQLLRRACRAALPARLIVHTGEATGRRWQDLPPSPAALPQHGQESLPGPVEPAGLARRQGFGGRHPGVAFISPFVDPAGEALPTRLWRSSPYDAGSTALFRQHIESLAPNRAWRCACLASLALSLTIACDCRG